MLLEVVVKCPVECGALLVVAVQLEGMIDGAVEGCHIQLLLPLW